MHQFWPLCVTTWRGRRGPAMGPVVGLLFALLFTLWGLAQAAVPLIELGPGFERMNLQPLVELLAEAPAALTPEQARDHPGFVPNTRGANSLGLTTAPLWVRFGLASKTGGPRRVALEVAYPLLDRVSLTLFYPDGRRQTFDAGDTSAFHVRPLHYANPTFPIELPGEGSVTVLLRLQTTGSLQFPLMLRDPLTHSEYVAQRYAAFGVYYGGFLSLALLACVIFVYARDVNLLLYTLYLSSYALLQFSLNGFAHQFLWPGPGMTATRMPIVLIGTTMICMMWLTIRFLGFWPYARNLRLAFRVFFGLALAIVPLGAFAPVGVAIPLASAVGILMLPLVLAAGLTSLRLRVRTAGYFVFAWGLVLFSVSISGLTTAGVLPSGFSTTYAMQIGSVLAIWILALALLDRVRSLREQKEAAVASSNRYLRQLTEDLECRVADRTRALQETNARLTDLARRDSLTGLLNHRASIERLDDLLAPEAQPPGPVAVIMLDLDHFKQINDDLGHLAGDRVLVAVAEVLSRHVRPGDLCGRYGGEEFLIGLRGIDETAARDRAEKLYRAIGDISPEGLRVLTLSASLGVAVAMPDSGDTAETVISRADNALYRAKALGRNRVIMASQSGAVTGGGTGLADRRP